MHEHNLLSLCNVAWSYVFRAGHSAFDNQLLCYFLGKTIFPVFYFVYKIFKLDFMLVRSEL